MKWKKTWALFFFFLQAFDFDAERNLTFHTQKKNEGEKSFEGD